MRRGQNAPSSHDHATGIFTGMDKFVQMVQMLMGNVSLLMPQQHIQWRGDLQNFEPYLLIGSD
jgi:hypothetical protein